MTLSFRVRLITLMVGVLSIIAVLYALAAPYPDAGWTSDPIGCCRTGGRQHPSTLNDAPEGRTRHPHARSLAGACSNQIAGQVPPNCLADGVDAVHTIHGC